MRLKGARVLLTGGSSGLGFDLANLLLEKGSYVVTCARHNLESKIEDENFHFHIFDVSKASHAKKLIDFATKTLGKIDILINNASVTHDLKTIEHVSEEDVSYCFQNNVFSAFNTIRHTLPIMKSQGRGMIINVSSRCGRRAVPRLSAYCASKFAVRGITEAVAKEVQGTGIKSISISPAGIHTQMRIKLFGEEEAKQQQSSERIASIICKIIAEEIQVPNGADIVIFKDKKPIIKVPES